MFSVKILKIERKSMEHLKNKLKNDGFDENICLLSAHIIFQSIKDRLQQMPEGFVIGLEREPHQGTVKIFSAHQSEIMDEEFRKLSLHSFRHQQ